MERDKPWWKIKVLMNNFSTILSLLKINTVKLLNY